MAYRHFAERHTGENIAVIFEQIIEEYGITASAMGYQVTDNARNMLKAFDIFSDHAVAQLTAKNSDTDNSDETLEVDNETDWDMQDFLADDDGTGDDDQTIVIGSCRLPCTAHTLQLAIKDALKKSCFAAKLIDEASSIVVFFVVHYIGMQN